jgi:hypothetical protein
MAKFNKTSASSKSERSFLKPVIFSDRIVRSFNILLVASGLSQKPALAISASISLSLFSFSVRSKIVL